MSPIIISVLHLIPMPTLTVQDNCRVRGPRTTGSCIRTTTSASPRWPLHGSSTGLDGLLSVYQRAHSAGGSRDRESGRSVPPLPCPTDCMI